MYVCVCVRTSVLRLCKCSVSGVSGVFCCCLVLHICLCVSVHIYVVEVYICVCAYLCTCMCVCTGAWCSVEVVCNHNPIPPYMVAYAGIG